MLKRLLYVQAALQCCRNDEIVYSPQPRQFIFREEKMNFNTSLVRWRDIKGSKFEKVIKEAAEKECNSLGTPKLCNFEFEIYDTTEEIMDIDKHKIKLETYQKERNQDLKKRQQKKEKEDKKKKAKLEKERKKAEERPKPEPQIVPVTIDEEPTTIIIKKELSTMDIVQISKLQKSIAKMEKQKKEQEAFLNMYNERIKSERIDLLLSSTKQRDEWQDIIDRTNRKIEKQQEAIEKIKISGG